MQNMQIRPHLFFFLISIFCIAATVSGCGGSSDPDYGALGLVDISGIIKLDGNPVPDVEVRFVTAEDRTYSIGRTDSKGFYRLMFDTSKSGIIPGKKIVQLYQRKPSESGSNEGNIGEEEGADPDLVVASGSIPKCYGPESKVEVEVVKSQTDFDIDFKSDCSTVSR
ncbi:MAG: hypothetical protein NTW52_09865 [Planctomycetota bacterium]|nr:hypothetical protein [Planctomycetota bacterium]